MRRKVEKWSVNVFLGSKNIGEDYGQLAGRELAIVAAASLDIGLAHLIEKKLHGSEEEIESFLGLNDDGRAPLGTFGARIQLALLLWLITEQEAKVLRAIKEIRNKFAHKININYDSPEITKCIKKLLPTFKSYVNVSTGNDDNKKKNVIEYATNNVTKQNVAETILFTVLCSMQLSIDYRIGKVVNVSKSGSYFTNLVDPDGDYRLEIENG